MIWVVADANLAVNLSVNSTSIEMDYISYPKVFDDIYPSTFYLKEYFAPTVTVNLPSEIETAQDEETVA